MVFQSLCQANPETRWECQLNAQASRWSGERSGCLLPHRVSLPSWVITPTGGAGYFRTERKRRATLATWSRTTGKCATDLEGLFVRPAPVKEWFRQPESNQHYMVRSHVPYPLNDGGMKRCPFQLSTGWRQTGAAPTLLPLGVDNTVVDFYRP